MSPGVDDKSNRRSPWSAIEFARAGETILVAFDMTECRGMDSTFVGTLVGLSTTITDELEAEEGWICMVNAQSSHEKLLEMMGADRFLRFRKCSPFEQIEWHAIPHSQVPTQERVRLIRTAHEKLVAIDERNKERFGAFLRTLESELSD